MRGKALTLVLWWLAAFTSVSAQSFRFPLPESKSDLSMAQRCKNWLKQYRSPRRPGLQPFAYDFHAIRKNTELRNHLLEVLDGEVTEIPDTTIPRVAIGYNWGPYLIYDQRIDPVYFDWINRVKREGASKSLEDLIRYAIDEAYQFIPTQGPEFHQGHHQLIGSMRGYTSYLSSGEISTRATSVRLSLVELVLRTQNYRVVTAYQGTYFLSPDLQFGVIKFDEGGVRVEILSAPGDRGSQQVVVNSPRVQLFNSYRFDVGKVFQYLAEFDRNEAAFQTLINNNRRSMIVIRNQIDSDFPNGIETLRQDLRAE